MKNIQINFVHRKGKGIAKEWLSMKLDNKNIIEFRYEEFVSEKTYEKVKAELEGNPKTTSGCIELMIVDLPQITTKAIAFLKNWSPEDKSEFSFPGPSFEVMKKDGKRNPHHI